MKNQEIIKKIFSRQEFADHPPVLLDIGASGEIYGPWREIAKYSICIAFDADAREIKYIEDGTAGYKKLYIYNKIVTDQDQTEMDFYLTKSPYCSSLLEPNLESLKDWVFTDFFKIEKKVKLPTVNLTKVLNELGIKKIDWFKTDSQGTDLRLFKALDKETIKNILVADFEPGIIDAYTGEDKLSALMTFMDTLPFWVNELRIPKTPRINEAIKKNVLIPAINKEWGARLNQILKSSPYCGEISYFNKFIDDNFNLRDYLLMWVLAIIKRQYGFALEIACNGEKKFTDQIFLELRTETLNLIKKNITRAKLRNSLSLFVKLLK
jgi:hypothetical protein